MQRAFRAVIVFSTVALLGMLAPPAQAATVVVPNQFTTSESAYTNQFPFGCGSFNSGVPSMRYQQVYVGSQVGTGTITQLGFRPFNALAPFVLPNVTIKLSTTAKTPLNIDTTFANNVGADVTTVFSGNLTVSSPAPTNPPTAGFVITLQTPFAFNASAGNLLLDITIPTCVSSDGGFKADFVANTPVNVVMQRIIALNSTSSTGFSEGTGQFPLWGGLVTHFVNDAVVPPAPTNCVSGNQPGNVNLTAGGANCVAPGTQIKGHVFIGPGVNATITGATIGGNVIGADTGAVSLCGSTVTGTVDISRATGFVLIGNPGDGSCAPNSIGGIVRLTQNKAGAEVSRNTKLGSTTLSGNVGSRHAVEANTINGSLTCTGNSPAATNSGSPNTVTGPRSGECGAAGF